MATITKNNKIDAIVVYSLNPLILEFLFSVNPLHIMCLSRPPERPEPPVPLHLFAFWNIIGYPMTLFQIFNFIQRFLN